MVEKAKKTPFKPLVKTQKQKEVEVASEDVFRLPWSVRLISVACLGDTIIALGDDRRLYKQVDGEWVTL